MSYILDALKKSQQERELGEVPTITTDQLGTERSAGDPTRWIYTAMLLAIAAMTIALFGIVHRDGKDTPLSAGSPSTLAMSATPLSPAPPDASYSDLASSSDRLNQTAVTPLDMSPSLAEQDTPDQVAARPEQPAAATPPLQPVPLLRQLPLSFQQSVPAMNVDVHVYLNAPNKRFVFINQRRYRQGERTTEGPVVEEIISDGVVLRHDGQRFRLTL